VPHGAALAPLSAPAELVPTPAAQENVSVELWDVSGNRELYEGTWPAIMHGASGIVYVYDATKVGEEKDLEQWCECSPLVARCLARV
jgi:GTPase SAR1 family protein